MKTRILSAIAGVIILAAVMYIGSVAVGVAVFILAVIGITEFYAALSKGGYKPVYIVGYLSCLPLLYLAFAGSTAESVSWNGGRTSGAGAFALLIAAGIFIILAALFCLIIFTDGKYTIKDIAITIMGVIYVAFLFSFVTLTRKMPDGYLYIWLIFIGAWATDTFAYFTGIAFGRTKILPKVSPKKSLEGSIGGMAGCIASMLLFGVLFGDGMNVPLYHFAILGAICGAVSQVGDWSASAVKRSVNIKDYGNIMPGHGGVLDRLDSILFVAPTVYFYINLFI